MILFFHIITGAVIAAEIKFWPLAALLALLSHYFLDCLPHKEYFIKNIKEKNWKNSKKDLIKILLDFFLGFVIAIFIAWLTKTNYLFMAFIIFISILPDFLTFLFLVFTNNIFLKKHYILHQKVHSQ